MLKYDPILQGSDPKAIEILLSGEVEERTVLPNSGKVLLLVKDIEGEYYIIEEDLQ